MVDPAISSSIGNELEVHREGYTALRDSVAAYLGPSSLAADMMERAHQEELQAIQNKTFLQRVVRTCLPLADGGSFSVSGADAPLKARRIQSQTLWAPGIASYYPHPFYVVGRKASPVHPNVEDLLLVEAVSTSPNWVATVSARRDDMKLRDELGQAVLGREFTDEQITASRGTFRIGLEGYELSDGCIDTQPGIRKGGKSGLEEVRAKGVRLLSGPKPQVRLPEEMLLLYETDMHIVELAYAFGAETILERLLQSEPPEAQPAIGSGQEK